VASVLDTAVLLRHQRLLLGGAGERTQGHGEDRWQVRSTGQVLKRTDWSPDGRFYRCACDYDGGERHWVKHQGANTRCLFVPMRSASRASGSAQLASVR
jgi:hypothetical protein